MLCRALVLSCLALGLAPAVPAQQPTQGKTGVQPANAEKVRDIRRLLDLTGAGNLGGQVMDQLLGSFKQSNPAVPARFWDDLRGELDAGQLTELVVPIYDRHLSHDDVRQVIAFYESPAGRKLISVQPQIVAESMKAGQDWGRAAAERILRRMKEQGYGPK